MTTPILDELQQEHELLHARLKSMEELCPDMDRKADCASCSTARIGECNQHLTELTSDLLSYMVSHFSREEQLMRSSGLFHARRDQCEAHMQDHGDMSETVVQGLSSLPGADPVVHLSRVAVFLRNWVDRHIRHHDAPLMEFIKNR